MLGIERRLKRDMFWYCLSDRTYFDSLDHYAPNPETTYFDIIKLYLVDGYDTFKSVIWYKAIHGDQSAVPEQGFKIHLSATSCTAEALLEKCVPILAAERVSFKVVADAFMLDFLNSKNASRSSSGKFVTIYPAGQDQFLRLLDQLHGATNGMVGPYILTDKPYQTSRTVYYRYGGFKGRYRLNVYGEMEPVIAAPDGSDVPDSRAPYFSLPSWVVPPEIPGEPQEEASETSGKKEVVLGGRFLVKSPILYSNTGGVYKGVDLETEKPVIIKEARPFVNASSRTSTTAISTLEKEFRILQRLEDSGYAVKPIALLQEWEHCFLVEEFLEGHLLSSFRALDDFGLLVNRSVEPDRVRRFVEKWAKVARGLVQALRAIHDRGVIIGDLSPNNIIINADDLSFKLIDFEGAVLVEEMDGRKEDLTVTMGFLSPDRMNGEPLRPEDDFYSLGAVLFSIMFPVQDFFVFEPSACERILRAIEADTGLPREVRTVIQELLAKNLPRAEQLLETASSWPTAEAQPQAAPLHRDEDLGGFCQAICKEILASATPQRDDRLWPSDYRLFTTNPLNLSYGALGIVLSLRDMRISVPREILAWIEKQNVSPERYAPGLYVGAAGVAWGLQELGMEDRARPIMEMVYRHPLAYACEDLFYGAAGWGLASLKWFLKTDDEYFLARAREAGDHLIKRAVMENGIAAWSAPDGLRYNSIAHGTSGIALFLLYLYHYTQDSNYLDYAVAGMSYDMSQAQHEHGHVVWSRYNGSSLLGPYWRYGNAGIGSVMLRFGLLLGEESYMDMARRAASYVKTRYSVFPGQFTGMAGIGEFLLDMHRFTGDASYLQQAHELTNLMIFAIHRPDGGLAFPGEELIRISHDFGTGSAGIGSFLHRLCEKGPHPFLDIDPKMFERSEANPKYSTV